MANLKNKTWYKYNDYEKKELLMHWWHYYGSSAYTFTELEKFGELLESRVDEIFDLAIYLFSLGENSSALLYAIRQHSEDSLLQISSNALSSLSEKEKRAFETSKTILLNEMVKTYNNPEPDNPIPEEELEKQIEDIAGPHKKNIIVLHIDSGKNEKRN